MSFFSTRGGCCVTASQAILNGLAPNGGLFVPAVLPPIPQQTLLEFSNMDYCQRAVEILSRFLEDYTPAEIEQIVRNSYATGKFDDESIVPVKELEPGMYVMELFHGPTLAFKDMALQMLPHLLTLAAEKNQEKREISILVATSGDTGKAALEGFRDVPGTSCTVFYPQDGVSEIQKLQMTTTAGSNTHVVAVYGNFDDAQTGVKELFSSADFHRAVEKTGKVLSSANSINFGRLCPQIIYYFSAYADLVKTGRIIPGQEVNFVVPTGNFGDILAGYYARCMGLPVKKLICASNRNNVLTDFLKTGIYSTHRAFFKTISPSMDILVSSNLERLLFEAADRDGELVGRWMEQLRTSGSYAIGDQRLEWINSVFTGGFADDRMTRAEILSNFEHYRYLMDPHTAVASCVLNEYREKTNDRATPAIIVSTASPYKFAADVYSALTGSMTDAEMDAFEAAKRLEEVSGVPVPPAMLALKGRPVLHDDVCDRDMMGETILRLFADK